MIKEIRDQMKKQQTKLLEDLAKHYPMHRISVAWDFESIMKGSPKMIVTVDEMTSEPKELND